MNTILQAFLYPLSPILALTAGGSVLIGLECFPKLKAPKLKLGVAVAFALASVVASLWLMKGLSHWAWPDVSESGRWLIAFTKNYRLDGLSVASFAAIGLFTTFAILFTASDFEGSTIRTELFALLLFIAAGMMVLVSASTLLLAFLGLELLSLPTYVLVGIRRHDRYSTEAALKYFLFGSLATVMFVFGIAFVYAHTGSLALSAIAEASAAAAVHTEPQWLLLSGMLLLLIATAFKVGAAPFHMWVPDVYQGAPTAVTGFMGSAIKLAGFGLAVRLFWEAFLPLAVHWSPALLVIAALTMVIGNVAALAQNNLKRLFAYSSVAHAGFLLLGVAAVSAGGVPATLGASHLYYYLVSYGLMFLGLFGAIALIERETGTTDISELAGLGFQRPFLGLCLALFSLSAAGIPPTAGFFAKYFVFLDAVEASKTPYVIIGLVASIVGVYYYLRILVYLYMKDLGTKRGPGKKQLAANVAIGLCAVAVLLLAVFPQSLQFTSLRIEKATATKVETVTPTP